MAGLEPAIQSGWAGRARPWRVMWRAIVVLVGFAILAIAAWVLMVADMGECDLTTRAALPSPDRSKHAVMFDVDCGATTGFNTQVAIVPANIAFDHKATPAVLVMDGRWSLPIHWIDDRTLHIRIPKDERYYEKLTSAGGVTIVFEVETTPTSLHGRP